MMTRKRTHRTTALMLGLALTAGAISGCATFRAGLAHRRTDAGSPPTPVRRSKPAGADKQAVLAAVEEFLERTQEYQSAEPSAPPASAEARPRGPSAIEAVGALGQAAWPPALRSAGAEPSSTKGDMAFANARVVLGNAPQSVPAPALPVIRSVSVRGVSPAEAQPAEPVRTQTTNEPLDMRTTETQRLAERFLRDLQSRADEGNDFDAEWQLRLVQLALDHDAEAVTVSSGLPAASRRILEALMHAALAVRQVVRDPSLPGEEPLKLVEDLRRLVAERADPTITTVALCRKVVTFGVYEEMGDDEFIAGQPCQTIVYTEIRNFEAERTDDGKYRTRLGTRLELLTREGRSMWQHEEPEIVDLCRRRRTDFFIAQRITLPPTLPAGQHVLKVLVEDKLSGKLTEVSRPLVIRSVLSVAERG